MLTSEIDVSCVKIAVQTEGQTMRKLIIAASLAFSLWATAAVANDLNDCILHVNNEIYQLALEPCTVAAEQGYASAQNSLGFMYHLGFGVHQNDAEAERWYRVAAEQGYAPAQYSLGGMYLVGFGVEQNDIEAFRWYRAAAEQGNVLGQSSLGRMYHQGFGVKQSYSNAIRWYRAAAKQGDARSQYDLGSMLENGMGVVQNYVLAHMWYNISASHNAYEIAVDNRNRLAALMTPQQIAEAQTRAERCLDSNYTDC